MFFVFVANWNYPVVLVGFRGIRSETVSRSILRGLWVNVCAHQWPSWDTHVLNGGPSWNWIRGAPLELVPSPLGHRRFATMSVRSGRLKGVDIEEHSVQGKTQRWFSLEQLHLIIEQCRKEGVRLEASAVQGSKVIVPRLDVNHQPVHLVRKGWSAFEHWQTTPVSLGVDGAPKSGARRDGEYGEDPPTFLACDLNLKEQPSNKICPVADFVLACSEDAVATAMIPLPSAVDLHGFQVDWLYAADGHGGKGAPTAALARDLFLEKMTELAPTICRCPCRKRKT